MEIETFRNIHTITDTLESRFREFDYCIPMCSDEGFFLEFGVWKALNEWIQECDREVQPLWRTTQYSAGVKVLR